MARLLLISALAILCLAALAPPVKSAVFTVGDSAGWDISADLSSWSANKIFSVGDALLFQYSKYHSVNEVDRAGYDTCNITGPLLTSSNGNTTVTLAAPGDRYFVCGVQLHCLGGMRLHVTVERNQSLASAPGPGPAPPQAQPEAPSPLLPASDFPFLTNGSCSCRGSIAFVAAWLCSLGVVAWAFAARA